MGYQLAFSKQELRKVIREYPGKEVKRGLEALYRKVEKHLCEEESLLQVRAASFLYSVSPYDRSQQMVRAIRANPRPIECYATL